MAEILPADGKSFDGAADIIIIGAGACGLTAALAATDAGSEVLILERDENPSGSTSLSSGFIPAAPTRFQAARKITDSAAQFANDIQAKAKGLATPALVDLAANSSGPTLEWLADAHGLDWVVLEDFKYPGHSHYRMHAVPERTGTALQARLLNAVENAGIAIAGGCHVTGLFVSDQKIVGVRVSRPNGAKEDFACKALILACNGYGGNEDMVMRHIPEIAGAPYFGHPGNLGDAVIWGEALGALNRHLSGYQGHGSIAHPHGVLITWAIIMEGGVQVNVAGLRFSNETKGYSEQAVKVLSQPENIAWNIYDHRLHHLALGFEDYRAAFDLGAVHWAPDAMGLAKKTSLPGTALSRALAELREWSAAGEKDPFGRQFTPETSLAPPYYAVRVTGALFHTQGGLMIDEKARVLRLDGSPFENLFAGGGAACGVSGPDVSGYLSGNGLLTALTFGRIAGTHAAAVLS
jgi:fumarate reductase flavoprotein subunit